MADLYASAALIQQSPVWKRSMAPKRAANRKPKDENEGDKLGNEEDKAGPSTEKKPRSPSKKKKNELLKGAS